MLFGIPAIKAASVDIGKHRALRIDIPDGWKLSSMVSPESGCLVVIQPSPEINAEIKLSVAFFSQPRTIDATKLDRALLNMCERLLGSPMREDQEIMDFGIAHGYGRFCLFTDLSQVPRTGHHTGFRVILLGIVQVSDDVLVTPAIAGDDSGSSVFERMKAAVSTIAIVDIPTGNRPNPESCVRPERSGAVNTTGVEQAPASPEASQGRPD